MKAVGISLLSVDSSEERVYVDAWTKSTAASLFRTFNFEKVQVFEIEIIDYSDFSDQNFYVCVCVCTWMYNRYDVRSKGVNVASCHKTLNRQDFLFQCTSVSSQCFPAPRQRVSARKRRDVDMGPKCIMYCTFAMLTNLLFISG